MKFRSILLCALLAAGASPAVEVQRADQFVDAEGTVHTDELVIFAQTISLAAQYHDDVIAMASEELTLTGVFPNDVWGMGTRVAVTGTVGDHLRVLGNSINVDGHVGNKLDAIGSTIEIGPRAQIDGGALLIGESVVIAGSVHGPLHITAQSVTLSGHVVGPLQILAQDIVVLPSARLEGDIVYESERELVLDPAMHPSGGLVRGTAGAAAAQKLTVADRLKAEFAARGFWLSAALLVGWPLAALFPRFMGRSVRLVRTAALRCGFVGAAAFCLLPMAGLLLAITIVGVPLAVLLLLLYGALLYISQFVIALAAGSVLLRWRGHQSLPRVLLILMVGLLLLYILTALPIVGLACGLATAFLGLGALLLSLFSRDEATPPPLPDDPPAVVEEHPT